MARSSAATRGGRIAAGWPAPARRSGPWGCGRRMVGGAPRLGRPLACPPACVARGGACGGSVRSCSWRGRPRWSLGPTHGGVTSAWRVAADAPALPWRSARRWPARPRPGAARRARPSNHGVQLTPLARFFELGAILVPSGAANACLFGCPIEDYCLLFCLHLVK